MKNSERGWSALLLTVLIAADAVKRGEGTFLHWLGLAELRLGRAKESSLLGNPLAPPRHDTTWRAPAAVAWRATDRLSWRLRASYARRNSNVETSFPGGVPLLDYERTVVSMGAAWLF